MHFLVAMLIAAAPAAAPHSWHSRDSAASAGWRLAPSAPQVDSLVAWAAARLRAGDTAGLWALSFSPAEFDRVYPAFSSDTAFERRKFSAQYYLMDNRKLMERAFGSPARKLPLSRFEVEGPVERFGPMLLYRNVRIWVRSGGGKEEELRLLKSVAKVGDGWKIWSFAD